ncbi:MAG: hypothetical protein IT379_30630 [Deltaproteobacteria bacterium]|nr:hypothetical protein [Deltaproteobacteria bacterium]
MRPTSWGAVTATLMGAVVLVAATHARADCRAIDEVVFTPREAVEGMPLLVGECQLPEQPITALVRERATDPGCTVRIAFEYGGRAQLESSTCPAGTDPWSALTTTPAALRTFRIELPADAPAPLAGAVVRVLRMPLAVASLDRFRPRALSFRHAGTESSCNPESILVRGEDGWTRASLTCRSLGVGAPTLWQCTGGSWYFDGDGQTRCSDERAQLPGMWRRLCESRREATDDEMLVCIDAREGVEMTRPRGRRIVAPHQDLHVLVLHRRNRTVEATINGERGYEPPRMSDRGFGGIGSGAPVASREEERDETESGDLAVSTFRFVPRRPGVIDLGVKLDDVPTRSFELIVDARFLGAIRLGIGAVTFGAVDRAYRSSLQPGSMQSEITAERFDDVDLELVLGFSLFVFDMIEGGRGYLDGPNYLFAPYLGLGLIGEGAGGTRALTSLWTGFEIEITPSSSIALGVVLRRVTRLAGGFDVGDAVDADTRFTTSRIGVGLGILINVSPEFARVAGLPGAGR